MSCCSPAPIGGPACQCRWNRTTRFAILPPDRLDAIVTLLRSAGVTRVHIHHLLDQATDTCAG